MTQKTLNLIHQSYQEALEKSGNIIQIVENLYSILEDAEVEEEDSKTYDAFVDGLRNCLRTRKMTSEITDIITYITITIMHIIKWLNITNKIDIDITLQGRRKSLESDLTKLLRKSNETLSAKIRDRFGLRGIILNSDEETAIEYIYMIHDTVIGILAAKNRKIRKDFFDWVENTNYVNKVNKMVIREILTIPFDIDDDSDKDYIKNQKPNGYQSLHFTLVIQPYSYVIPGLQLEVQLRTRKMNEEATTGSASHAAYKQYISKNENSENDVYQESNPITKVFVVDDFSRLNIPGFKSYDSKEDDSDGIHFSKDYANRRISYTLAPSIIK